MARKTRIKKISTETSGRKSRNNRSDKKKQIKKKLKMAQVKNIKECPYCHGTQFVKSGFRLKKYEKVQVFFCRHCQKKFTPLIAKGKTYPLAIILKSLIWRNRFYSPEMIAEKLKKDYGFKVSPDTISNWIREYRGYMPFCRMWGYLNGKIARKEIKPSDIVAEQKLFHKQIYDFGYHRGKTKLIIEEDYKNYKLGKIQDFLEMIVAECPHKVFQESSKRASEFKNVFNLDGVRITRKENLASEMTRFVMQSVANNKERHKRLQEFMLFCDSTTLAVEVPVLLDRDDILHYQKTLNFEVPIELDKEDVITGHIDFVQLRNGIVHIMDFKPSAKKYKPIEQLTIYALALSRLTSLRMYCFKCAWFDEDDYFEFYPLHVVYKKQKKKGRRKPWLH